MALRIYNVRTKQKEEFQPLVPGKVGLYLCGLTVYDHMHIGHARTALSFEIIRRWLERSYDVDFVQNVTDVEDKIIARAKDLGISPLEHAATWDAECRHQSDRLGVRAPDKAPHATTSMDGIIAFIGKIIDRGFAYATADGNVYFDVPKYDDYAKANFPDSAYGHLSRRDYREMAAGTRKDVETDKQHPADFALWKAVKPGGPADAQWESPWSAGRPGWHIECSHMSTESLGVDDPAGPNFGQIDIHGGGQDLIFPHHENEIAQTQAMTGRAPFVNYWVHAGFLNVDGTKMSKSLHNFITLKDALDELEEKGLDPEVLRFYYAQTHYRSKIDFSRKGLDEAATAVERLNRARRLLHEAAASGRIGCADVDPPLIAAAKKLKADFAKSMDDDFHTPGAIAAMFTFLKQAHSALDSPAESPLGAGAAQTAVEALESCGQSITLFADVVAAPAADFDDLLAARETARATKNWAEADRIRDEIMAHGFKIQDTPAGPRLERL